jgi:membrane protein DedA with SNARE-associated domain
MIEIKSHVTAYIGAPRPALEGAALHLAWGRHPNVIAATLPLALRLHHHIHGPRTGYLGLVLAAAASWIGLPGPGEAALVTAGVLAVHHRLDLLAVVLAGWIGAVAGGTAGWLVGRLAGRRVLVAPGPLYKLRVGAVARGDRLFERYGAIAVFFAPSWAAGLAGMRTVRFFVANAASALVWAAALAVGSYAVGPIVLDLMSDAGTIGLIALGVIVVCGVAGEVAHHRRRARRS